MTPLLAFRHLDERVDSGARDSSRRAAKTKRIVTKNERREGERGECDRVYQRLAGDENDSTRATSVIMHVDVKIVIITLVAL